MPGKIVLFGMSHKTAPVETREVFSVGERELRGALTELLQEPGVREAVMLNTCNRVELVAAGPNPTAVVAGVRSFLERRQERADRVFERSGYVLEEDDAIRHLFRVASSLDSLVVGEPQILGQVKKAFAASQESGAAGTLLHRTFNHAFGVAKRVRTETKIAENAVSISYAAVELARKVFGKLKGKRVLVVGAGKMGGLAVRHLRAQGADRIDICNRSLDNAREMAEIIGGTPHPLDELPRLLADVDIVITSTGSQHYVVKYDMVRTVLSRRKYRPLFLIDIAVPRDIDPRCDGLDNVYLFDVDDLEKVIEENMRARQAEAQRAERIIDEETRSMREWIAHYKVVPTIVQLREKLTDLKDHELNRFMRRHADLDPKVAQDVEKLAHMLVNKILHDPTITLRESSGSGDGALAAAVRSLFKLNESEPDPKPAIAGEE